MKQFNKNDEKFYSLIRIMIEESQSYDQKRDLSALLLGYAEIYGLINDEDIEYFEKNNVFYNDVIDRREKRLKKEMEKYNESRRISNEGTKMGGNLK
jgi:hypothetical protein